MANLRQKLRQVEQAALRLTGDRRQAAGLRRKIERHIVQLAAGRAGTAGRRREAAVDEAEFVKNLVRAGQAGWVNDPALQKAVLVERGTGCALLDAKNKAFTAPKLNLPSKPAIKKSVFLRHLKSPAVENFVPHMYRDRNGHVTVGIGQLLRTANDAKQLTFTRRGTNVKASALEIELDFDNVTNAPVSNNSAATVYLPFTKLEFTEARAEQLALDRMREFLRFLRGTYFPEFDTYPVLVKMGLLDLAYQRGARGARDKYPEFTAAMARRNWKWAGVKQRRDRPSDRADLVQAWFNQAARGQPFFCKPHEMPERFETIGKMRITSGGCSTSSRRASPRSLA
jgi:hypothetical protein